ncbi:hypothetical protein A7K99_06570 [Tatumella citrea]|uniref:Uncharacterized protein n=1 Tax=Tatumella citrea TaxID=53336 RepID=A0A1Y0LHD4_TATCI|nr:hypothetical protein A7K98_06570 [Tatumella citrea]ARU97512.1 hypothetical protein A7K99_06570 [Tatumella citrea]
MQKIACYLYDRKRWFFYVEKQAYTHGSDKGIKCKYLFYVTLMLIFCIFSNDDLEQITGESPRLMLLNCRSTMLTNIRRRLKGE